MIYNSKIYSYKIKNKYKYRISFIFLFLFMWVLFGWNNGNSDYDNYQNFYNIIGQYGGDSGVEAGFEFICRVANKIGLNYNEFLAIYSFIGLSMIVSTVRKYANNTTGVMCLYFIYPFMLDIVQIRNFMSMCIIIFAIRYLVDNNRKGYIKYCICVLIASTIHITAIFYMLFLITKIKSYKKLVFVTFAITISGLLFQTIIPMIVYKFLNNQRYDLYLLSNTSFYAKVLFILYFLVNTFLIYYAYMTIMNFNKTEPLKEIDNLKRNKIAFTEVVMKINILVIVSYAFIYIDVDFVRLYRNILPINYILFSMIKSNIKITKSVNKLVYNCCCIAFVALSSWAFIFLTTYDSVVYPIFNNNNFFNYFK